VKIDTNTAETFRHGIWYTKEDVRQELQIVPLTLAQYQAYFNAMFESGKISPFHVRELLLYCGKNRAAMDAPAWKRHIEHVVRIRTEALRASYVYEAPPMQAAADPFAPYRKE
jgi:hypothetical protein